MAENKKYYWLKLKSDFFDDDTIKYIEEQENGIKYSNFYLKLCLKSLKTDGKLIRLVGETLIPYDVNSLAKLTGVDFDTVRSAMQLFENIGLIKILDSGEIHLAQINELIGSETDKAQMMRRLRAERQIDGNIVTKMLPYIEKDIDIDKELEIEKRKDNFQKVIDFYNNNIGQLTPYGLNILESYKNELENDVIIYAMQKSVESNKRNMQYIKAILNNWTKAGIRTMIQVKDEETVFKQKNQTKENKTINRGYADNFFDSIYAN